MTWCSLASLGNLRCPRALLLATAVIVVASAPAVAAAQSGGTGQIVVTSEPPGLRVLVDGQEIGQTPVVVPGLLPGAHLVSGVGTGGARTERVVDVVAGQSTSVTLTVAAPTPPPPPPDVPELPAPDPTPAPAAADAAASERSATEPIEAPEPRVADEPLGGWSGGPSEYRINTGGVFGIVFALMGLSTIIVAVAIDDDDVSSILMPVGGGIAGVGGLSLVIGLATGSGPGPADQSGVRFGRRTGPERRAAGLTLRWTL